MKRAMGWLLLAFGLPFVIAGLSLIDGVPQFIAEAWREGMRKGMTPSGPRLVKGEGA